MWRQLTHMLMSTGHKYPLESNYITPGRGISTPGAKPTQGIHSKNSVLGYMQYLNMKF